jgi:hypothetical protein
MGKGLKIAFVVAATSAGLHLPGDINDAGKAIKSYNMEKTYLQAYEAVTAAGSQEPLLGCSDAYGTYRYVLSHPGNKLFSKTTRQTGERFYSACKPFIK